MKRYLKSIFFITCLAFNLSCANDFLEVKQDQALRIPHTLEDCEAIINGIIYSRSGRELAITGADEYTVSDGAYNAIRIVYQRNAYIWADNVYEGANIEDWNRPYSKIMYANLALETLDKIKDNSDQANKIKARALFHRAYNYYQLSQTFIPPYQHTDQDRFGLPLRLESDVTVPVPRSSVRDTYLQIIADTKQAIDLMDDEFENVWQPSKRACYALLAKLYLMQDDLENALAFARLCQESNEYLIDFSTINTASNYSFAADNGLSNHEIIFYDNIANAIIVGNNANISNDLLNGYTTADLRKDVYFRTQTNGNITFKGSYTGGNSVFCGLANDEIFLIRAEAATRLGLIDEALQTLNKFLKTRYDKEAFAEITTQDKSLLLATIFSERRKELVLRGTRWEDLRRNVEGSTEKITREINDKKYELNPGDNRYTWPIPEKETEFGKIEQNPR